MAVARGLRQRGIHAVQQPDGLHRQQRRRQRPAVRDQQSVVRPQRPRRRLLRDQHQPVRQHPVLSAKQQPVGLLLADQLGHRAIHQRVADRLEQLGRQPVPDPARRRRHPDRFHQRADGQQLLGRRQPVGHRRHGDVRRLRGQRPGPPRPRHLSGRRAPADLQPRRQQRHRHPDERTVRFLVHDRQHDLLAVRRGPPRLLAGHPVHQLPAPGDADGVQPHRPYQPVLHGRRRDARQRADDHRIRRRQQRQQGDRNLQRHQRRGGSERVRHPAHPKRQLQRLHGL